MGLPVRGVTHPALRSAGLLTLCLAEWDPGRAKICHFHGVFRSILIGLAWLPNPGRPLSKVIWAANGGNRQSLRCQISTYLADRTAIGRLVRAAFYTFSPVNRFFSRLLGGCPSGSHPRASREFWPRLWPSEGGVQSLFRCFSIFGWLMSFYCTASRCWRWVGGGSAVDSGWGSRYPDGSL